jgi:hypothetical protein
LISITKGGNEELYCAGSVLVERQDVPGDKQEGAFTGADGHVDLDLPSEWKSLIVRVYNVNILPGPHSEPAVVSLGILSTPVVTGNENQLATVKFNYPTTTSKVQIQTSEEAMTKFTESLKETFGWNVGVKASGEVLTELAGKIPGIGDAKKIWKFMPELSGGVSGSTETGSTSETGSTVGQKKTWDVTVSYVDFTVTPELYINGVKQ